MDTVVWHNVSTGCKGQLANTKVHKMQTSKTVQLTDKVVLSKKAYRPAANSQQDNSASWEIIQKALSAKGGATRGQLENLLKTERNHKPFVGYAIRRGWLVAN